MSKNNSASKIILATLAIVAMVASIVLVVIYASLAIDVIGYFVAAEKEGAEGLGAAVGLIVMVIIGIGIVCFSIVGIVMFVATRRMTGGARRLIKIAFVYHVLAAVLAIITLLIIKFLS